MVNKLKQTLIIANPKKQGWNHLIAEGLKRKNPEMAVIDLYDEKFSPLLQESEIGERDSIFSNDSQVRKYQEMILETEKFYLLYPIWWGGVPAILKGFFERVFSLGFAYIKEESILKGKLTNIEEVVIMTTSASPKWCVRFFNANSVKAGVGRTILKASGVKKVSWQHLSVTDGVDEARTKKKIEKMCQF